MDFTKWKVLRIEDNYPTCYIIYEKDFILKWSQYSGNINVSKHTKEGEFIKWIQNK